MNDEKLINEVEVISVNAKVIKTLLLSGIRIHYITCVYTMCKFTSPPVIILISLTSNIQKK